MSDIKTTSSATTFQMQTGVTANIKASPEKVMNLLTNTTNATQWNSTLVSVEGKFVQGERVKIVTKLDPKRTFNLLVETATPTTLVLKDGFAPLFSAVRTYTVAPAPDGSTDFSMVEVFKGITLPMVKPSLPDFKPSFEQYAADLKKAAEQ